MCEQPLGQTTMGLIYVVSKAYGIWAQVFFYKWTQASTQLVCRTLF